MLKNLFSIALLAVVGVIAACIDDAGAGSSGISQAQFDALAARVASLEAQQHRVLAEAPSTSLAKADAVAAVGTFMSFDQPPSSAGVINIRSPMGYLFAANLVTGEIQAQGGLDTGVAWFETTDCTGAAYTDNVSKYGVQQGSVFRINGVYYAIVVGTPAELKTFGSAYNGSACANEASGGIPPSPTFSAYPLVPNDPAVTGVESAPIAVPVTVG